MGWLYTQGQTKQQLVSHLLNQSDWKAIANSLSGNHLWVVFERKPDAPPLVDGLNSRWIALFLLASHRGYGWGYKDIEESMGPCETDCPLRYFDMVPDPGGYATAWRQRVRESHKIKSDKRLLIASIRPGMRLKLVNGCKPSEITVVSTHPTLIGVDDSGGRYRIRPRHVQEYATSA